MVLDQQLIQNQKKHLQMISDWKKLGIEQCKDTWWKGSTLVVVQPHCIQHNLVKTYHNSTTGGHPGIDKMTQALTHNYWWPRLKDFVMKYVKGCAICQQNKTNTH